MPIVANIIEFVRNNLLLSGGSALFGFLVFVAVFFRDALLYEYKRMRESGEDEDRSEWFRKTASLARQVQRVWDSKYVEPKNRGEPFSHDEVKGEMGLLADQLDRHATSVSQDQIPPEVINLVYETAQECRSLENIRIGIGQNPEFQDKGEEAVEKAEELERAAEHRS